MFQNTSSRRDFLRVAAGSTLAGSVAPSALGAPEPGSVAPSDAIRLMVKEFELDPLAEAWLFVDSARSTQAALPTPKQEVNILDYWRKPVKVGLPPSTEEYAVSIAASLGRHFLRLSRAVGLVSAGSHLTLLPPDRGGRQLGKILEALALLRAEGELPIRGLVETQAKHIPKGSTVVLITPTAQAEFAIVVEFLLRRGLRPIAVLIDASSFGGRQSNAYLLERIRMLGVSVRHIRNGDNLEAALSGGFGLKTLQFG